MHFLCSLAQHRVLVIRLVSFSFLCCFFLCTAAPIILQSENQIFSFENKITEPTLPPPQHFQSMWNVALALEVSVFL